MSEKNHICWPDGAPKSTFGAVSTTPLFKAEAKRGPKPMRVNPSRPFDPNPQASADKTAKIKGGR